ncbi:hypothetical protein [Methanobrevibacter sp.]|uniref:hypothetical protein n=1 Tax=Methanobrevibacter sp. TaxID=66852 RepID=UPI0026DFCDD6|nr:hypothetical protein [Methanobrevibacter sp.]MDO5860294.1 hypothetical protein [Methanobrevibacter sp.]
MGKNNITIMIVSTIPDMFAEHYYFIKNVFPKLKEFCQDYDINLDYVDLFFSMSENEFNHCRSVRKYFESVDLDRTFFICFRGQKLGCTPNYTDIDKLTLEKYPELVDYIGNMSFTELIVTHALHPFEKCDDGNSEFLSPVKHSLFYFRNDYYLDDLNCTQREVYTCSEDCEDNFVSDLELAMAKDIVFHDKREFEKQKDVISRINIRKYDGIWDDSLDLRDVIAEYTKQYADLKNLSFDDLMKLSNNLIISDSKGAFKDFKCESEQLENVMVNDFINELKLEFPDCF